MFCFYIYYIDCKWHERGLYCVFLCIILFLIFGRNRDSDRRVWERISRLLTFNKNEWDGWWVWTMVASLSIMDFYHPVHTCLIIQFVWHYFSNFCLICWSISIKMYKKKKWGENRMGFRRGGLFIWWKLANISHREWEKWQSYMYISSRGWEGNNRRARERERDSYIYRYCKCWKEMHPKCHQIPKHEHKSIFGHFSEWILETK